MIKMAESTISGNSQIKRILKGTLASIIITVIMILIYAIILTYSGLSENSMSTILIIITGISVLIGSEISIKNVNKNGIFNGGIIGLTYILLLYLLSSTIIGDFSINTQTIIIIITSIGSGMLGGIIGINLKK